MILRLRALLLVISLPCLVLFCSAPVASALEPTDEAFIGVWLFDEGEGDTVADETPNQASGVTLDGDFEWEPGKFGSSITAFGGGSIDVDGFDIGAIDDALTVAAWFRVDADSNTGVRMQNSFLLEDQSLTEPVPNGFSFRIWTDQGLSPGFYGTTELEQGEWYHVAGVYDGETMELYINGTPESELGVLSDQNVEWEPEWGGSVGQGTLLELKFGTESYFGGLDEIVILNRALSADEIGELMNGWTSLGGVIDPRWYRSTMAR